MKKLNIINAADINESELTLDNAFRLPDPEITFDEWLNYDVSATARHEAGHYLVAKHLGVAVELRLWRREGVDPNENRVIGGQCGIGFHTNFQKCCIGWGGIAADEMHIDLDWSPEQFDLEFLEDPEFFDVSASDARFIESHCQKMRAGNLASKVIRARQEELQAIIDAAREKLLVEKQSEFKISAPGKPMRTVDTIRRWKQ